MMDSPVSRREPRPLTGKHVLFMFLGFFGVIIATDSLLIYKALSTFGGVDNVNAYRDGLAYNKRIETDARQAELGWESRMSIAGAPARLEVALAARDGSAVSGRTVIARVSRPATNRFDRTLVLSEGAPGVYEAALADAGEGAWIVALQAFEAGESEDAPVFQVRRRLWIAP